MDTLEPIKPPPACSMSYQQDPLESAIYNAASAAQDAEGLTLLILQKHLKKLCTLQLSTLSGGEVDAGLYDEPK